MRRPLLEHDILGMLLGVGLALVMFGGCRLLYLVIRYAGAWP